MNKIEQIKEAIEKADKFESNLSPEALEVPSLTSLKIRHLLNNLASISTDYCEVGSHRGGTFVSAIYGNTNLRNAVAIDDYSESFFEGDAKSDFTNNASRFAPDNVEWELITKDSFSVTKQDFKSPFFDMYLYDGDHSLEAQKKALTYFLPFMDKCFIFLCDDFSWERVKIGTLEGIKKCGLKVLFEQEFITPEGDPPNENWHNGYYIALLEKQ